jgi:hypothetical protein
MGYAQGIIHHDLEHGAGGEPLSISYLFKKAVNREAAGAKNKSRESLLGVCACCSPLGLREENYRRPAAYLARFFPDKAESGIDKTLGMPSTTANFGEGAKIHLPPR